MVSYKPGDRLRSQVCATEVVVVRAGIGRVELWCGGVPMVGIAEPAVSASANNELLTGNLMGKRYTAPADPAFEVLVSKSGDGTLSDGPNPLLIKQSKPLPASD